MLTEFARFILASWVGYPTRKPLLFNGPVFRGTYNSTIDGNRDCIKGRVRLAD